MTVFNEHVLSGVSFCVVLFKQESSEILPILTLNSSTEWTQNVVTGEKKDQKTNIPQNIHAGWKIFMWAHQQD
jgi:hypothetical protein